MAFTEAKELKIGDRVTHAETRDMEFGTIVDIKRGVWKVRWTRNSGLGARMESIPMGVCSKLEKLS